jgi:hypothetical protein
MPFEGIDAEQAEVGGDRIAIEGARLGAERGVLGGIAGRAGG